MELSRDMRRSSPLLPTSSQGTENRTVNFAATQTLSFRISSRVAVLTPSSLRYIFSTGLSRGFGWNHKLTSPSKMDDTLILRWVDIIHDNHTFIHIDWRVFPTLNRRKWLLHGGFEIFVHFFKILVLTCVSAITSAWYFKNRLRNDTQIFLISSFQFLDLFTNHHLQFYRQVVNFIISALTAVTAMSLWLTKLADHFPYYFISS